MNATPTPAAAVKCVAPRAGLGPKTDRSGHVLIYTHIPKSAGTTLDYILMCAGAALNLPWWRAMGTIYGQFHGPGKPEAAVILDRTPAAKLAPCRILTGHLPHGAHRRFAAPSYYVTILREPVARLISQFRFGALRGGWKETDPIEDLCERGLIAPDVQTRQIAGAARGETCDAAMLARAQARLDEEYALCGTADRFDAFLADLLTLAGWPAVAYMDRQVAPGSVAGDLRARAEAAAARYFAHDQALYRHVDAREGGADSHFRPDDAAPSDAVIVTAQAAHALTGAKTPLLMAKAEYERRFASAPGVPA